MFFVFGPKGQMFRGPAERLGQVAPVRRVQRPQALRTRAADVAAGGSTPFPAILAELTGQPAHEPAPRRRDAVDAYVSTEKGPQQPRQPLHTVADVMSREAVTVGPEAGVNDAWRVLAEHGVAQAPVLDADGRVVGLLLRADMAPLDLLPEPGAIKEAIALARRPVHEVMISPIPTVARDTDLRRVAGVLLDTGLPGLPVTDDQGLLAGFISRTDILRAVASDPPLDLWS
ncbi:putative manganese-dependent inorganic pyrophosphatase [Delftia tsuruhatensis]|uniref:CBS domain-containing protein n=1 Tax=Delftia tsuruhatensis TaxID=180282 RepID=UPI001E788CE2|nr:CBS domain-containing protein [Delftia tsuruhatensis]CAB5686079.1 putative manganese-dependent inorganic pyrophosphatase [Delftia tsuruhatensis]CAC9690329.1 putative manganese-dependent inorganic pyrophosphatase [Delftia tsuruhatensis]